jgi:hypothetical protein
MLPNLRGACPLILLVFSHYASVTTDRKGIRYESVKVKKKFEVKLDFNLMKEDMENINSLRVLLKKFYSRLEKLGRRTNDNILASIEITPEQS